MIGIPRRHRHTAPVRHVTRRLALCLVLAALIPNGSVAVAQDGGNTSTTTTIHVVQRGENLFRIAMRYGTTIEAIAQANGIKDATQISVGQRLLIPNVAPSSAGNSSDAASVPGIPVDYVVQPGDSLINLSLRYGMPIAAIARQNRIVNPAQVYVGLNLSLKEGAGSEPAIKTGWLYIVQPDDNLYRVAARYGASITRLARVNKLRRTSVLFPGQHLVIPGPDDGPALIDIPQPFSQIAMQPAPAEQGRTMSLRLTTSSPAKVQGTFMGKPLVVYSDGSRQQHTVLYGIHAFAKPGVYTLNLTAVDDQGRQTPLTRLIEVIDGGYISETIALPPDQLDLINPKVTQPEQEKILRVVSNYTSQRYFDGPMGLPCSAPVTSQFGTRRSYNNGPYDQFHTGTDFAGAPGSPVYAPAAGVVKMAETLNVRGNATIIDHGWGVYTGYWHQTEIKVKVGDVVKQGQIIGTVGSTGRVTGPHLHWELFVGGVQVDPLQWARQSFS